MSYLITKSNGELLLNLGNGQIDVASASVTFVGKNYLNFGQIQNNNFLHLTENFAAITEPPNKLNGQLWFDTDSTSTGILKVYNINNWQPLAVITTSTTASSSKLNFYFNENAQQLFVNSGTGFSFIGPEGVEGYGKTRAFSTKIKDTSDVYHPVIITVVNDENVSVISQDTFDVNLSENLTGLPKIYRGITFKNGQNDSIELYGWSEYSKNSNKLLNSAQNSYITATIVSNANTIVQRNAQGGIVVTDLSAGSITGNLTGNKGNLTGEWTIVNGLLPDTNGGAYLGATNKKWNNIYSQNIVADVSYAYTSYGQFIGTSTSQITASTVDTTAITAGTATIGTLRDSTNSGNKAYINHINTDNTLGGASTGHDTLSTQRAIKEYIDGLFNQLSGATGDLGDSIANLQNALVPVASVFYTAAVSPPNGFLFCDGSSYPKASYQALANALGAAFSVNSTTFKVPDLRGEFVRGLDKMGLGSARGVDSGRTMGSSQTDLLGGHDHTLSGTISNSVTFTKPTVAVDITDPGHTHSYSHTPYTLPGADDRYDSGPDNGDWPTVSGTTSKSTTGITAKATVSGGGVTVSSTPNLTVGSTIGAETRPRNVALNAIIKY